MTTTQISSPVSASERSRGLFLPGVAAAVAAAVGVMLVAATLKAIGVDYELPDGGESVPLTGFAFMTFVFSAVGLGIAAAIRRWSWRPRARFVQVTVFLTAVSLVPPFLADANAGTVAGLIALHLTAAAIAIPLIARRLAD